MALAIQSQSNTSVLASVAATFPASPNQDNLLIAVVIASVGVGSISLSNSGWSTGGSIAVGLAGGMVVFYKISDGTGSDQTVTANATLAAFMDIQIFEYQSVDDEVPLDKTASTADSGSGVTSRASGTTATLTQAQEIAFVAYAQAGSNGGGAALTNSFNVELTTTHLITGDISVNATTALSSTASWNTSQRAAGVILTFFGEVGDSPGSGLKYGLKPRLPVINWNNPISKGLVLDVPQIERGSTTVTDIVGRRKGTLANAPTWTQGMYGPEINFGTGLGTQMINFTLLANQSNLTNITVEQILNLTSNTNQFQRGFFLGTVATPRLCFEDVSTNHAGQWGVSLDWSGGEVIYGCPQPPNGRTHIIVTYSFSSTSNTPLVYYNGIPQTMTLLFGTVSGTPNSDSNTLTIGNSATGDNEALDGSVVYTRVWNRILNQAEVKQLAATPWSIYIQPGLIGTGR